MKKSILLLAFVLGWTACTQKGEEVSLQINEKEYFECQGINILVFNSEFSGIFNDEKTAGIQLIHHGVRTAQGGAVRLNRTPEQWDLVPKMTSRTVDAEHGTINIGLRYEEYDFDSRVTVESKDNGVEISVWLDEPVPESVAGEAGFNLEFLPSQYWSKTFVMDGHPGRFPRYAVSDTETRPESEKPLQYKGYKTYDDRGTGTFIDPLPLASGHRIVLAPECPERKIVISSMDDSVPLELFDGRMVAQNGWFVLRSVIPAGKTGKVISWTVEPNAVKGWIREPNIGFSQVGYVPDQPKMAVIELDCKDKPLKKASVFKYSEDGDPERVFTGPVALWGPMLKYNYCQFDFSDVREPGIYFIRYGGQCTENFTGSGTEQRLFRAV